MACRQSRLPARRNGTLPIPPGFFETFVLVPFVTNHKPYRAGFEVLFNSYYNAVGQQFPRDQRGLLSRPSVAEVLDYREVVNAQILDLLSTLEQHPQKDEICSRIILGLHHEQQHQELFFTDIKYSLAKNILYPAYCSDSKTSNNTAGSANAGLPLQWLEFTGGLQSIGAASADTGDSINTRNFDNFSFDSFYFDSFCFDNETPSHQVYLEPFMLANRLVTNRDYLSFIEDNGYLRAECWLADAWALLATQQSSAPFYWQKIDNEWCEFTLYGLQALDLDEPLKPIQA